METLSPSSTLDEILLSDKPLRGYENVTQPDGRPGRFIPRHKFVEAFQTRDMTMGTFAHGGALDGDHVSDLYADPFRQASVLLASGATELKNQPTPTNVPVFGSDITATFLSEVGLAPESDLSVSLAQATAKRLAISVTYSALLATQNKSFRSILGEQVIGKVGAAIDLAGIQGTGGVQPIGIITQAGTGSNTVGGTITWPKALSFEQQLANANAVRPDSRLGFVMSPDCRAKWKSVPRFSGGSIAIMNDDDSVAGDPTRVTTELSTANGGGDKIIYGDFRQFWIFWFYDGLFCVDDKYTNSKTGEITSTFTAWVDLGLIKPGAMLVTTDAGNQ
jgi:HK97 family phage major capsid protein